ncbi:hypothetical protein SKAU_G00282980 [Synaphobranchus kaupii]|uniref:Gypsy retrotransposon integrase-like protein 1 n=1 Tax=Synaphobranchus kaupii TaxID=118154 RepID=A0A9Q1IM11_SYNKA|nr:hypothetical protein SKAU_G00282980 [Synaphobranchus kaupii]
MELSSTHVLAPYSAKAETCVSADASSYGIGAVLTQKQPDSEWRPVVFISRGLTGAEKHYTQIEKEALAATWACERLSSYLLGMKFTLETDHKPLLTLLSEKALDELPPRILRFRLRMLKFSFDIIHVAGKKLITADTLSRAPVQRSLSAAEKEAEAEVQVFVDAVREGLPASEENLSMAGNLLLRGQRIIIPTSLREEMLNILHNGHQGIIKCRARARQSVWWPGLTVHIQKKVETCATCEQHKKVHREPLMPMPVPQRPWQRLGTDLFHWDKSTYLLVVDYFSRYIEVAQLHMTTTNTVIAALKNVFGRHGVAETIVSDNGPQYSSSAFQYRFEHITSSPRYPQANGEAERAVATVKNLWKDGGENRFT